MYDNVVLKLSTSPPPYHFHILRFPALPASDSRQSWNLMAVTSSSGPPLAWHSRSLVSFCARVLPHLLVSCSGLDLGPSGRGEQGPLDPCPGLWGRDLVMASILRLLLLRESKLSTSPLFWDVAMYTEDSWLIRSPSFRSLLLLSS